MHGAPRQLKHRKNIRLRYTNQLIATPGSPLVSRLLHGVKFNNARHRPAMAADRYI